MERATSIPDEQSGLAKRERSQADAAVPRAPAAGAAARTDAPSAVVPGQEAATQKQRQLADTAKSPEQWLREIEQLRREGRHDEASVRLEEFRKLFPHYSFPPSLK